MPKGECFDRSDFYDFDIIKSLWGEGATLCVKLVFFYLGGSFRAAKFLTPKVNLISRKTFLSLGKHFLSFFVTIC